MSASMDFFEIPQVGAHTRGPRNLLWQLGVPRGSRYLIIKELGLKDHDYYGFWGLSP